MSLPYDFYMSLFLKAVAALGIQISVGSIDLIEINVEPPMLESVILDLFLNYNSPRESIMGYVADKKAKVEREVIHAIVTGEIAWLRPKSGQPIMISGHNISVQCHEKRGDDYRVWEWHGHVMTYNEENGYSLKYIFGNFVERIP